MRPNAVAVCMIVRDEADNLRSCLDSVHGVADEAWIVDTGSKDGTPELAQELGANVLHFSWVDDFAAARNAGIAQARAEWILVLDADERLHPDDKQLLIDALAGELVESVAAFILPVHSLVGDRSNPAEEVSHNVRLFRNSPEHRYHGAVHEQIEPSIRLHSDSQQIVPLPVRILHHGYLNQTLQARQKPARNLAILERLLQQSPRDYHLQYHAAICLCNLGREPEAIARLTLVLREGDKRLNYVARCLKVLVVILRRRNRADEALAALDRYQQYWPDFTDLQYLRALVYQDLGDIGRALDAALGCRAQGEAPPPYDTHSGVGTRLASRLLGMLAEKLGNLGMAERAFGEIPVGERAFRLDVSHWLRLLADRVGSNRAVAELVRRLPGSRGYALAADVCAQAGLYRAAMQFNELADELLPSEAALFRGRCLFALGQLDGAVAILSDIGRNEPAWATANLWLAYTALALESVDLLQTVEQQGWGALHPENSRLLNLIKSLITDDCTASAATDLLLPLLTTVAPHVGASTFARGLALVERDRGCNHWLTLAGILFRDYHQVELAWQAYGHRPAGMHDPWLEAALYREQGEPRLALSAYSRALADNRSLADDYLQAARICREQARILWQREE